MKTRNYKPTGFQLDYKNLNSDKVQFWSNGVMMTVMPKGEAIILVKEKRAFVISDEAIGSMENGYSKA